MALSDLESDICIWEGTSYFKYFSILYFSLFGKLALTFLI